jgi:uncharacterized protein YbjT (DUF2867 family)
MIVITTPTGNIGSKVLRNLVEAKQSPLRVVARTPEKLPRDIRAEVVEGSMEEPGVLRKAFRGAEAVFWCQPDAPRAEDYLGAYEALAEVGAAALAAERVARVVAISATGAMPVRPAGPITALRRMEAILARSGAACRFLRCGSFFENVLWQWEPILHEGRFVYPMAGNIPGPQVATRDIASVAARLLAQRDWQGSAAVDLAGPEELTYDRMAEELSRHLGRPVRYEAMPADAYREMLISFGQSPSAAQALVDMFAFLADGYVRDPKVDRSLTPTTFREWVRESAPPAEAKAP